MDDLRTELDEAIGLVDSPAARIRLAGLLRLVRLADAEPRLRQGVVTVLGAYLRRPVPAGDDREARSERDTRAAALSALRGHLADPTAATTWCGLVVDLRGSVLTGDLSGVVVTGGGALRLDGVLVPAGGVLDLHGARVSGGLLSLDRLDAAGLVDLTGLHVEDGDASLDRVTVADGGRLVLDDAVVADGCVSLRESRLDGTLSLRRLRTTGGAVTLHEAHLTGGELRLDGADVDGGRLHVSAATVEGGALRLDGARVTVGLLSLTFTAVRSGSLGLGGVEVGEAGVVRLDGLVADDDADVEWGPFAAVPDTQGTDGGTAVVRDLDLRGPAPEDRWAWLREDLRDEVTTPDAPGRQVVPSPTERAAS